MKQMTFSTHYLINMNENLIFIVSPPKEDICYATQNRQEGVSQFSQEVDLTLVLGSPALVEIRLMILTVVNVKSARVDSDPPLSVRRVQCQPNPIDSRAPRPLARQRCTAAKGSLWIKL